MDDELLPSHINVNDGERTKDGGCLNILARDRRRLNNIVGLIGVLSCTACAERIALWNDKTHQVAQYGVCASGNRGERDATDAAA